MIQARTPGYKVRLLFRILAVATLVSAFTQVTLGGVVRVTGSGLGCPDWPLCHGQLIPPFEFATLVEYTHRLSASVLSIFVLATVIVAFVYYRSNRWALWSSVIGLLLVVIAAVLGGATVLTELKWWVRLFHLGIAEGVVAAMVIASLVGSRVAKQSSRKAAEVTNSQGFNRLLIATLVGVFLLILSGSYMVGFGAGSSCATWPLCRGSAFPQGEAFAIHMGHRYIAALIGVLVIVTAVAAWRRREQLPSLGWAGIILVVSFAAQILFGAWTVWSGFSPEMKGIHLSLATLVWIALVFVAAIAYAPQRFEATAPEFETQQLPKLEGLA